MKYPNLTVAVLSGLLLIGFKADADDRPNVVLILADDMGWGDVGYHGFDDVITPNIDKLAKGGTQFSQAYTSASVCGPSRAGLMTGVYQQRFGFYGNSEKSIVPHRQQMLAEMLKRQGYRTGMLGKWHLGVEPEDLPLARGFDFYYGSPTGSHDYFRSSTDPNHPKRALLPVYRNDKIEPPIQNRADYLTDIYADEAVGFIERNRTKPFFLYVAHNSVHYPWQVADRYVDRLKSLEVHHPERRHFAGMVLALDDSVGRIIDCLEDNGLANKTLVFFLSDNGSPRGQGFEEPRQKTRGKTTMSSPGPFNGFKGDTYEGGFRVPLVAYWPGIIPAGKTYHHPVISLDIAATAAALCDVTNPSGGVPLDGVDLLPFITGEHPADQRPHDVLYWRRDDDYAIRTGDWKLAWNDQGGPQTIQLFDLANDPGEWKDLSATSAERAQSLQDMFDAWDSHMADNRAGPSPTNRNEGFSTGNRVNVADYNEQRTKRREANAPRMK